MDIFFLQLIVIFIPGILWERIDSQYGRSRSTQQWDILRRSFTFGLASYLITFGVYWVAGFFDPSITFYFFDFKKDASFLDSAAARQIAVTSAVALVCSIGWLYQANNKVITRILQRLGATKRYGDEDIWDYMFNSGRAEVEYLHLRDFEKKLVYCGWVESWSESERQRELVLRDVIVYDIEGTKLFETPRVYLARKADNIDIEFPYRVEKAEESHDGSPAE